MHSTQGPCWICGVTTAVVCVQCGLGLQFCRACLEAMLQTVTPRVAPDAPPADEGTGFDLRAVRQTLEEAL